MRELWFYKFYGNEYIKHHPKEAILPDRNVIFKGDEYSLIQRDDVHGLIEDDNGRTQVVNVTDLKRGFGKHTPGHRDGFFDVSGDNAIYAGQWIFIPARKEYEDEYVTKFELAVVCAILTDDRLQVYRAMDGSEVYVKDENVLPLSKDNQEMLNSKGPFRKFKEASANNLPMKAKAYALGGTYARLCAGLFDNQDLTSIKRALSKKRPKTVSFQTSKTQTQTETQGQVKEPDVGKTRVRPKREDVLEHPEETIERSDDIPAFYATEDSGLGVAVIAVAAVALVILAAG